MRSHLRINSLLISLFGIGFFSSIAQAQSILSDGSLNTSVATPDGRNFVMTHGTARDQNLFHSFREFSVPTNGSATFNLINTPNIKTIFNRVTGSSVSNLDGVIQTVNANSPVSLFILNPNGIVVGANAKLAIAGSFIGTTANSLQFADGTVFDQTTPAALLTMSAPVGLQFGQSAASITVNGTGHRLTSENPVFAPFLPTQLNSGIAVLGQTIALVGGEVKLNGGMLTAYAGRVELGGVQAGTVRLTPILQGYALNYDTVSKFGDVSLAQRSLVDVNSLSQAGAIQVQARNLALTDGSALWVQNRGSQTAGDITVKASESIKLAGTTADVRIRSSILNETVAPGANGNVTISAPQVSVEAGAGIASRTYRSSEGGALTIQAGSLNVSGYAAIAPSVFSSVGSFTFADKKAGDVTVTAQTIDVKAGGFLGTSTIGTGSSGKVRIDADAITVAGVTPSLVGSLIAATTIGRGGNGGDLTINTRTLSIQDSGLVAASSIGQGSAGTVRVTASDSIEIGGQVLGTYPSSIGAIVDFPNPELQRVFQIPTQPQGNAGGVIVKTPVLRLSNQGGISVVNKGIGNAGTLSVTAGAIQLKQGGFISASTRTGIGGNVAIAAQTLLMRDQGSVRATASGDANGGNITLDVPMIVALGNSDIVAFANQGRGGNITITTQAMLGLQESDQLTSSNDINASSKVGVNGTIQITHPTVDLNAGVVQLHSTMIDPNQTVSKQCQSSGASQFIKTGRGGIPTNPQETVRSDRTWSDLRDLSVYPGTQPANVAKPRLIEATSWRRNAIGKVELIAVHPSNISSLQTASCSNPS